MNIYMKSGIVSLISGMLGASLTVAVMDFTFGLDVAINSFFKVLPRSICIGGVPSLILAAVIFAFWKKSGKNEKGMIETCLITGFIVGVLCGVPLYISYGM